MQIDLSGPQVELLREVLAEEIERDEDHLIISWLRSAAAELTSYLTNLEANGAEFREVRGSYFPNKAALPASTLLQISRLANPTYLVEVEVIAVIPRL
jgi:enamine deaminase RidA (YjgF/YER057c/UK114 family)